jgi:hypothetical protein
LVKKFLRPKDCEISPRKNKKNQFSPTIINPKDHWGFRRLDTKRVGERGMQKPLLCFLLPTFAPLEREREREREGYSLHFAWCRSDCTRGPSFSRGRASGFAPLSSIARRLSTLISQRIQCMSLASPCVTSSPLLSLSPPHPSFSTILIRCH